MRYSLLMLLFLHSVISFSQELVKGNVIPDYGKTYKIKSPQLKTDTTSTLKVVFDVDRGFASNEPNKLIETAARYLNMHELAGVKPENMHVALVIHGKAVNDVLQDKYYKNEFPDEDINPNSPLLKTLSDNGVEIIVCGQSATYYNVTREKSDRNVDFALSAMTALVQLQNDNYRLIKF